MTVDPHDWPPLDWTTPRFVRHAQPRDLAECLACQPLLRDVGAGGFAVWLAVSAA